MTRLPPSAKKTSLRLCLFKTFRIERDARPVALPTRKVESLLAYLALFPEPHPREKLAALLWGDSPDEQARHSLRSALTTLRGKLGDDLLLADRETVQINPDCSLWVDALEFQQSAVGNLPSAIELYQGDLLPDFYDDWIEPERERLRALYRDALLQLAQAARSHSQYSRAIELARKALASDPANEKAYQHIIFCLAAMGDRIGALKQYDECEKKLRDELGVEPSSETAALREQIERELTGTPSREALLTNVPTPLTSFIGRQREVAEIKRLLNLRGLWRTEGSHDLGGLQTRLLTLTGAGGCGKTRLAIQVATDLAGRDDSAERLYKNGVWWVELAALSDPALVPKQVAHVFELLESPGVPPTTTLVNYLRAKESLLVLDNCEHLIEACAQLTETLLSACPSLQILATSREALGLTGEVTWYVPSLDSPDPQHLPPLDSLAQYDAIRLLTERARAVAPHWQLAEHAQAAARICCRLDGIPLAIELAAARLKVLSAEQVDERLDDRFQLLTGGSRTALPRQRTLRAAIDWSYEMLSDEERVLFQRLAVFAGGWTLEAAEHVCADKDQSAQRGIPDETDVGTIHSSPLILRSSDVLDVLSRLVDKSIVVVEHDPDGRRYRLLETIRQYAGEKLAEANESEAYFRRHLDWFIQLAERAEPKLRSGEQLEWCERLDREMENIRAALAWSLGQTAHASVERAMRLAGALWWFWIMRGYLNEGRVWLERSLENQAITPTRARALMGLGLLEYFVGTMTKCYALFDAALALYRQQGDKWGIAYAAGVCGAFEWGDPSKATTLFEEARLNAQGFRDEWLAAAMDQLPGIYAVWRGDLSLARSFYESALDHARRAGDRNLIGGLLNNLGLTALRQGDDDHAILFLTESLGVRQALRSKDVTAGVLVELGRIVSRRHDSQQASKLLGQALALYQEMGNTRGILECLWRFGDMAALEQQYECAARLLGAGESLCENLMPKDRSEYEDAVRAERAQLGEATFNAAWAEGQAMTLEQAIEYALKA